LKRGIGKRVVSTMAEVAIASALAIPTCSMLRDDDGPLIGFDERGEEKSVERKMLVLKTSGVDAFEHFVAIFEAKQDLAFTCRGSFSYTLATSPKLPDFVALNKR